MRASVAAGRIVDQPSEDTLSDGSAGGVVRCFVPILCHGTPTVGRSSTAQTFGGDLSLLIFRTLMRDV